MPAMHRQPCAPLSRRAITGVLVRGRCVLAAGIWAPMARAHHAAQGMERLCSGDATTQWVSSPAASAAQDTLDSALHHLIDCPLCMPVLAPPPQVSAPMPQALPAAHRLAPAAAQPPVAVAWLPPARGPPVHAVS